MRKPEEDLGQLFSGRKDDEEASPGRPRYIVHPRLRYSFSGRADREFSLERIPQFGGLSERAQTQDRASFFVSLAPPKSAKTDGLDKQGERQKFAKDFTRSSASISWVTL